MTKFKLPGSGLLSYSGMSTFLSCPRKYAYRYIDKLTAEMVDADAMERGKVFHKMVETSGGASDAELMAELSNNATAAYDLAKTRTAFSLYNEMTQTRALPPMDHHEVKLVNEEQQFIGYVDGIGVQSNGKWYLGEIKTTSRFDPVKWGTLSTDYQIAFYTQFAGEFAHSNFLDNDDLTGVSYRTIVLSSKKPLKPTKKRLEQENPHDFEQRIAGDAKVYHAMVVPSEEARRSAMQSFGAVKEAIHNLGGRSDRAHKNPGNCRAYNRPCEFFTQCWGIQPYSDEQLDIVDDDVEGITQ